MKLENAKITLIKEVVNGTTKAGKTWQKVEFLAETTEDYNNLYCFEIFAMEGKDTVDNFIKFNKVGQNVDIDFNIKTSEWQGKHFTSLAAWKVFKAEAEASEVVARMEAEAPVSDGLPF